MEVKTLKLKIEKLEHEYDLLRAENERLKEQLAEHNETHRRVVEDKCPSDEMHCGCVSYLRAENEGLRILLGSRQITHEEASAVRQAVDELTQTKGLESEDENGPEQWTNL